MNTNPYWQRLKEEINSSKDLEQKIDLLRRFAKQETKNIQVRDLAHELSISSLFEELTALAEAVVQGSYVIAYPEVLKYHPEPKGSFSIIAMGKFGGRELTYRSDLDIIYLFENREDQEFYSRLGVRIINALTLLTREGYAYLIDTALRPSGNAGTLVSTLDAFQDYHQHMGRTWERQALIKARPILDNNPFSQKLVTVFQSISYQEYDPREIARDIDHLRMRMEKELSKEKPGHYNLKTGRGGIVDIEFMTQYLQLIHGKKYPELRIPTTQIALQNLGKLGFLDQGVAKEIGDAYLFFRGIETRLRLILDQPTDLLIEGAEWMKGLEDQLSQGPLLKGLLERREYVRSRYEKVFHDS